MEIIKTVKTHTYRINLDELLQAWKDGMFNDAIDRLIMELLSFQVRFDDRNYDHPHYFNQQKQYDDLWRYAFAGMLGVRWGEIKSIDPHLATDKDKGFMRHQVVYWDVEIVDQDKSPIPNSLPVPWPKENMP